MADVSSSRFAEPVSFYVEGTGTHVVLDVHDYDEGCTVPVRIHKDDLRKMIAAEPVFASAGVPQTSTPDDQRSTT
jgi:hypothetical protein